MIVLKTRDEPEPPERKGFSETEAQAVDERKKKIEKSGDKEKSRTVYRLFRKRFETLPFGDLIGTRTRVYAVRGRRLNRLTIRPSFNCLCSIAYFSFESNCF